MNLKKRAGQALQIFGAYWIGVFILAALFGDYSADFVFVSAGISLYAGIGIMLLGVVGYVKEAIGPSRPKALSASKMIPAGQVTQN